MDFRNTTGHPHHSARDMTQKKGYQSHLSYEYPILKDVEGRTQKFKKILSVIQDFHPETRSLICIDIGCSSGIITSLLGEHFKLAIGLDIDQEAIRYAKIHSLSSRVDFLIGDSMALPFNDESVDVIVCNHVYEHVPESKRLMDEIHRVLNKDGFCYFAAGNRYVLIEGHYHLPFLSWFPKSLAHLYLKLIRKGKFYYEEHLSLRSLRQLVNRFRVYDYTLRIIRDPERFHATDLFNQRRWMYQLLRWIAPYFYWLIPTYVWVLTKKDYPEYQETF
jgi:SAM-dependent methyltransferase